ncbi:MAG: glycerol-3-phosphate acyltransferase [Firmicutes bacterium]|nr:glycerol-3-phosphate acyltransferase [Bacillota bacterium]
MVGVLVGFTLGSIPFSVWLGRAMLGVDIRDYADHNPGATNAWRAGGWKAGLPAAFLDYSKGLAAVALTRSFDGMPQPGLWAAALGAVAGHAFSPLLGFRGGKAVAATFGVWTGLMGLRGFLALGVSGGMVQLVLLYRSTDGVKTLLTMVGLCVYLAATGAPPGLLVTCTANAAIMTFKQCQYGTFLAERAAGPGFGAKQ